MLFGFTDVVGNLFEDEFDWCFGFLKYLCISILVGVGAGVISVRVDESQSRIVKRKSSESEVDSSD